MKGFFFYIFFVNYYYVVFELFFVSEVPWIVELPPRSTTRIQFSGNCKQTKPAMASENQQKNKKISKDIKKKPLRQEQMTQIANTREYFLDSKLIEGKRTSKGLRSGIWNLESGIVVSTAWDGMEWVGLRCQGTC